RAQYHLGVCLARGIGIKANEKASMQWLMRSSANGYQPATDALEQFQCPAEGMTIASNPTVMAYVEFLDAVLNESISFQIDEANRIQQQLHDQAMINHRLW